MKKTKLLGVFILIPILESMIQFDIIFLDVHPALANIVIILLMVF